MLSDKIRRKMLLASLQINLASLLSQFSKFIIHTPHRCHAVLIIIWTGWKSNDWTLYWTWIGLDSMLDFVVDIYFVRNKFTVEDFHWTIKLNKHIHCFFGETSTKARKQNLPLRLDLGISVTQLSKSSDWLCWWDKHQGIKLLPNVTVKNRVRVKAFSLSNWTNWFYWWDKHRKIKAKH